MKVTRLKIPTIVLAAVALVVGVSSGAVGAKLITGSDIKNGSVTGKDIKKASLPGAKLQKGAVAKNKIADGAVTSGKIADGTIGPNDLSSSAFGPNWSVVDRNVIGNGDSFLRAGPSFSLGGALSSP